MNRQQLKALLAANDARLAAEAARAEIPDTRSAQYRRKPAQRRVKPALPNFSKAFAKWEKTHTLTKVVSQFGASASARVGQIAQFSKPVKA